MVRWSYIVGLLATLALAGCGAAKPAQAPESNPWADYKGTYAPGGTGEAPTAPEAKATPADSKPEAKSAPESKTASAREPKPKKGAKPKKLAEATPEAEPKRESKSEMKPDDAKSMYGVTSEAKADDAHEPAKKATKKHAATPKRATKKPATAKR